MNVLIYIQISPAFRHQGNLETRAAVGIASTWYSLLEGTRVSWRNGWSGRTGAGEIQDEPGV